jgi:hypothetical protein
MILSKLLVALGLDATDYQKGLEGAERETSSKLSSIGGKLKDIGGSAQKWGAGLTAGVTLPVVAMGLGAIDAASDMDESMSKVGVVFGEAAERVVGFSETAATALGQSQSQALEATGTFGNLFVSMGLGDDASADMSIGLTTLASDLASFNNSMPEEALDALRAGLTGETEPLKRFGVNINAAAVGAKALELGLADVEVDMVKVQGATLDLEKAQGKAAEALDEHGASSIEYRDALQSVAEAEGRLADAQAGKVTELTAAQKAQAVYALVMDQTATAQGDFIRTSEGLANSTRIAKAQLADAAATMGQHLLPIGIKVVAFVNNLLERFRALSPSTQKIIIVVAAVAAAIGPLLLGFGTLISIIGTLLPVIGAVGGVLGAVAGVISGPVILAVAAVVAVVALLAAAWKNDWGGIRTFFMDLWETKLKPAFETIKQWLGEFIPKAIETLKTFWDEKLLPAIKAVWSFIETYLIPLFKALANVAIALVKKAVEALAALWENVLKPALETVWEFIENNIIPIFQSVVAVVSETLGPKLEWLKEKVLDPLLGVFAGIGDAISDVIGWLTDLATKIAEVKLPDWLSRDSPAPIELTLQGMNEQLRALNNAQLPRFEQALAGVGGAWTLQAGAGNGTTVGGDTYIINNHNQAAAALSWAIIQQKQSARLNASMGGT